MVSLSGVHTLLSVVQAYSDKIEANCYLGFASCCLGVGGGRWNVGTSTKTSVPDDAIVTALRW